MVTPENAYDVSFLAFECTGHGLWLHSETRSRGCLEAAGGGTWTCLGIWLRVSWDR